MSDALHPEEKTSGILYPVCLGASVTQKYSVWIPLDPSALDDGVASSHLQTIVSLTESLSEQYKSPRFLPHVTVMGGLEPVSREQIHECCCRVASETEPFTATLTRVQKGDTFFQSVFGAFDRESADRLCGIHRALRRTISLAASVPEHAVDPTPVERYNPHVSFIYGLFADNPRVKDNIVAQVYEELSATACAAPGSSFDPDSSLAALTVKVPVFEMALVHVDLSLPINSWTILKRYPFKQPP